MIYNGIRIEMSDLYTKEQVLDILKDGGTNRDLDEIRADYLKKFENELIWIYPHMVGDSIGETVIPVQEGFLSIAHESVNSEDYEVFDLNKVFLLSEDDIDEMKREWKSFSNSLISAMESTKKNVQLQSSEIMKIAEIIECVDVEVKEFRKNVKSKGAKTIYNEAYNICLVEEIVYLICEVTEEIEEEYIILTELSKLCAKKCFLSEFLHWALDCDSIDVSNIERSCNTLTNFCEYKSEEVA